MPTKLREFYWNELLTAKDAERQSYEKVTNKSKTPAPSMAKRR
jgi:hypothetical protein